MKYKTKYISLKNLQMGSGDSENHAANIEKAWAMIMENSTQVRTSTDRFDGLGYWKGFKGLLVKVDENTKAKDIVWNRATHDKVHEVISEFNLKEHDSDGSLNEPNHFLLQQINIPRKDGGKTSCRRLLQIALNIGQAHGSVIKNANAYPKDILRAMRDLRMDYIDTYMTRENYGKYEFTDENLSDLTQILNKLKNSPPRLPH